MAVVLTQLGCSATSSQPITNIVHPKPLQVDSEPPKGEPSEYVASDKSLDYGRRYFGGEGRALVNGVRVAKDALFGTQAPGMPLEGGRALPSRLGGGFLFWNREEFFLASDFTQELRPAGRLPVDCLVSQANFGDDFVLAHCRDGGRAAWSPTKPGFVELPEPGLIDIAVGEDGRAAELSEPNRLLLRAAHGHPFVPHESHELQIARVDVESGHVVVRLDSGMLLMVDAKGNLDYPPEDRYLVPELRTLPRDSRYKSTIPPRQKAFQGGVLVANERSVIEVDGAFGLVDLRSGLLLKLTDPLAANLGPCVLFPVPNDVLGICESEQRKRSIVVSHLMRLEPVIEQSFEGAPTYFLGAQGSLVKTGPCDRLKDEPNHLSICLREPGGTWKTLDVLPNYTGTDQASAKATEAVSSRPPKPLEVVRWVPTPDGDAVGIVLKTTPGLYHARSRRFVPFTHFASQLEWSHRLGASKGALNLDFEVREDGHLVGATATDVVELSPDGKVSVPKTISLLGTFRGATLLGVDKQRNLCQSTNHGSTWEVIRRPRGVPTLQQVPSCSYAGCIINDWYRIGFPSVPPEPWVQSEPAHSPAPPPAPKPRLVCQPSGAARKRVLNVAREDTQMTPGLVGSLGAHAVFVPRIITNHGDAEVVHFRFQSADSGSNPILLAHTFLDFPSQDDFDNPVTQRALYRPHRITFHVPFTPPKVQDVSIVWGELLRSVERQDSMVRPLQMDPNALALPVLSADGKGPDGLALLDRVDPAGFTIWVRPNKAAQIFAFYRFNGTAEPASLLARPDGSLVAVGLLGRQPAAFAVSTSTPTLISAPRPWERKPPRLDVGALKEDGTLAILRFWSSEAPTKKDPALVFTAQQTMARLAPWSTLVRGPCGDGPGYRAIVDVEDWIGLEVGSVPMDSHRGGRALVHWNEERVCLEAVEIPHGFSFTVDGVGVEAIAQVRFETKPKAARYYFEVGEEYVEPLDCQLLTEG